MPSDIFLPVMDVLHFLLVSVSTMALQQPKFTGETALLIANPHTPQRMQATTAIHPHSPSHVTCMLSQISIRLMRSQ